jgi:hypothetical protein
VRERASHALGESFPDRPVLYLDVVHWEVLWVACGQPCANSQCGGGDQTVGLAEGDPFLRVLSARASRVQTLFASERSQSHPFQEAQYQWLLAVTGAAQYLLDVDRADPRQLSFLAQSANARSRSSAAQRINQHCCVKQDRQPLADASGIARTPNSYPGGGVCIPLMP